MLHGTRAQTGIRRGGYRLISRLLKLIALRLKRLQHVVEGEAAGLLAGRELLERGEELPDVLLRRHEQEDTIDPALMKKVLNGEIVTMQFNRDLEVPGGLIHEWVGDIFLPNVTLEQVMFILLDYDHHKNIYPEVLDSKLLERHGNSVRCYLKMRKQKSMVTVVLNSEYDVRLNRLDPDRCEIRSRSARIEEVQNFGDKDERVLPVGKDSGFLWRLNAYWCLKAVRGGVILELTTLSLSRQVPFGLFWIKPYLTSLPRESIVSTLRSTQLALDNAKETSGRKD